MSDVVGSSRLCSRAATARWKNSFLSLRVTVKTAMSLVGTASPTSKTLKKRCSSASRHISRSGLIRELNGTRANCRRAGKDRQRDLGLQSGEGVGVLAANVRKFTLAYC